jgi:hypothetical protein
LLVEDTGFDVIQKPRTAANFLAFVKLESSRIWLRANESAL